MLRDVGEADKQEFVANVMPDAMARVLGHISPGGAASKRPIKSSRDQGAGRRGFTSEWDTAKAWASFYVNATWVHDHGECQGPTY